MNRGNQTGIAAALCLLACARTATAQGSNPNAPYFTAASIVQSATQLTGTLAPNTIATIYGTNLSFTTHGVTEADLNCGTLPTTLDGVTVYVNGILSNLLYISPGQINFLIPYEITVPTADVVVARQGVAGPTAADGSPLVTISLADTAPGFFEWNGNFAIAQHADGTLITATSPAQGSEVVVLYAEGLGRTSPDTASGVAPVTAANMLYFSELQILVDGVPLPTTDIYYAGVTPEFAGLYQINIRLPQILPSNPEIQIIVGTQSSPAAVQLYAL